MTFSRSAIGRIAKTVVHVLPRDPDCYAFWPTVWVTGRLFSLAKSQCRELIGDSSAIWLHSRHLNLDSKDQPARRWLNSSKHIRLCALVPFGSSPFCPVKAERGLFGLSRKTALHHTVRRNMGGPPSGGAAARAREEINTHRPTGRENVRSLTGCNSGWTATVIPFLNRCRKQMCAHPWLITEATRESGFDSRCIHSETCGFLFLSLFMSNVRIEYAGNALVLFWGLFLFSSGFCFLLVRSLTAAF